MTRYCAYAFLGLSAVAVVGCAGKVSEVDIEKVAMKLSREVQAGQYRLVSTGELKSWLDQGSSMLIIDTMPYDSSFRKHHLPGAIQFELPVQEMADLDAKTRARLQAVLGPYPNRRLVFYCGFTECGRSHNGAMWAVRLGYTEVYRHPGGIRAWLEAGYPTERGESSGSQGRSG